MEMVYGLSPVRTCVDDQAVAVVEVLRTGDVACFREQCAEETSVLGESMRVRADVAFRDDEDVDRRLRVDVGKSEDVVRFVETFRWNSARDDLAEEAIWGGRLSHREMVARLALRLRV